MSTLHAPDIEGFEPVNTKRVLDVDYLCLSNDSGVILELSEAGIDVVDQNQAIASLITRMGEFIAEHDGYKNPQAVKIAEPCDVVRVSSREPDYHGGYHYSSVYHPHAAGEVMIKAFDFDPSGAVQFNVGAWMNRRLAERSEAISSPRQLAMLISPNGRHKTTIAEYVPGTNLHAAYLELRRDTDSYAAFEVVNAMDARVKQQLQGLFGGLGRIMLNDLRNHKNLIVVGGLSPDRSGDGFDLDSEVAIVDQPKKTLRALALHKLISLISTREPGLSPKSPAVALHAPAQ